ncbi:VOC family protein [Actinomadura sp. 6K520]|uniref:VOC family protein n=1 Tax=Actinomadura sp. 6K520 TaxID=2530364 RepID=UPI00104E2AC8|nr:VOC family protein [Actinomadura sp. 6K520]TDE33274.1 VOC family protein [Actinomadura sp. 6K520]
MPEMTSYAEGAPSWVELLSPDTAGAKAFYGGLLGWGSYTMTLPNADYEIFTLGKSTDHAVAGMMAAADDGVKPTWTCYFNVDDLESAVARVGEAGGTVFVKGSNVAQLGRLALVADIEGAGFGLWKPYTWVGAAVVDEPGTMSRVELICRDADAAQRFYSHVLGWKDPVRSEGIASDNCFEWEIGGRPVTGAVCTDQSLPAGAVAYWMPYFAVTDSDDAAVGAVELGGTLQRPSSDTPTGRVALLSDPSGAALAVIQLAR